MFRISIVDKPSRRTLVVEGRLVGPWVAELRKSWSNASQELGGRKLVIDLRSLTGISREGEDAIFDLMKKGATFSCAGVLMSYVLKQLAHKKPEESPRRRTLPGTMVCVDWRSPMLRVEFHDVGSTVTMRLEGRFDGPIRQGHEGSSDALQDSAATCREFVGNDIRRCGR